MSFASPIPGWAAAAAIAALILASVSVYRREAALSRGRAALLASLRAASLVLLFVLLLEPVRLDPRPPGGAAVAILVDASRSMGIDDTDETRLARARAVAGRVATDLRGPFEVATFTFGGALSDAPLSDAAPIERRSDLRGAVAAVRERYRDRRLAATVLLSDGADTGGLTATAAGGGPVFAVPIGSPEPPLDREVVSLSVDEEAPLQSLIDLTISVASRGSRDPFMLRVLENGRAVHSRRVEPAASHAPVRINVPIAPPRDADALYTVEIDGHPGERVTENNRRSVIVRPAARRRAVLLVEGAPGFEHSFLKRSLTGDPALDVDAVVRKGQDDAGNETFYVQAAPERAAALESGLPSSREALFRYDALVLANIDAGLLTTAQLSLAEAFVSQRGGGLLVLGARSFDRNGLRDTPLEPVLPVALTDRGDPAAAASGRVDANRLSLTADGLLHPIMRLAADPDGTREAWRSTPGLASTAALGRARPGALVLATSGGAGGLGRPLIAVQRYGEGRSMIFGGEAAWRWRMQMPADDGTYDSFWRQSLRWLSAASPSPVEVHGPADAMAGEPVRLAIRARDAAFAPSNAATVTVTVEGPAGEREAPVVAAGDEPGAYTAVFTPSHDGVYRATVRALFPGASGGGGSRSADVSTSILVGGADAEMSEPWRHDAALARIAEESGGALVQEPDLDALSSMVEAAAGAPELRETEVWHAPWVFALLIALLTAEWSLRRRWQLR